MLSKTHNTSGHNKILYILLLSNNSFLSTSISIRPFFSKFFTLLASVREMTSVETRENIEDNKMS
jgi:hypothetical protein